MVRLDKNKIRSSLGSRPAIKREPEKNETPEQQIAEEPANSFPSSGGNDVEKFSQYVLKQLINESVPPTPNNFQIYFDKLLEGRPIAFRKRINELLEAESVNDDEYRAMMEKYVKEGFGKIKDMLQAIATVYKNIITMKGLVKKRLDELGVNTGQLAIQNIITAFEGDLEKLSTVMEKQLSSLKQNYESTGTILKSIEQEAIFDSRYGIYNKRYLIKSLIKESEGIEKYNYSSTLMLLKIKDAVLSKIPSTRDRSILLRNIAKLLLKTSRRSDVVAHYGEGVFAMVMKHTNISNAQKACERITELIYATSFFIGEMEIDIDIELSILELKNNKTPEESIITALDALKKSGKKLELYAIANYLDPVNEESNAIDEENA